MPICALRDESDWACAMRGLEVSVQWQEAGAAALASEVRLKERTMGVTADDRRSMRIRFTSIRRVGTPAPARPV